MNIKTEREWEERAAAFLKHKLRECEVTYVELANRLKKHGFKDETEASITMRLKRGTFPATGGSQADWRADSWTIPNKPCGPRAPLPPARREEQARTSVRIAQFIPSTACRLCPEWLARRLKDFQLNKLQRAASSKWRDFKSSLTSRHLGAPACQFPRSAGIFAGFALRVVRSRNSRGYRKRMESSAAVDHWIRRRRAAYGVSGISPARNPFLL